MSGVGFRASHAVVTGRGPHPLAPEGHGSPLAWEVALSLAAAAARHLEVPDRWCVVLPVEAVGLAWAEERCGSLGGGAIAGVHPVGAGMEDVLSRYLAGKHHTNERVVDLARRLAGAPAS